MATGVAKCLPRRSLGPPGSLVTHSTADRVTFVSDPYILRTNPTAQTSARPRSFHQLVQQGTTMRTVVHEYPLAGISRRFTFAVVCLSLAVTATALFAAAPSIARPASDKPVTVLDNGRWWTLDNGIVKATINKRSGNMMSLVYRGINTMGGGGYWEQTPQDAPRLTQTVTIDPAKNGGRGPRWPSKA